MSKFIAGPGGNTGLIFAGGVLVVAVGAGAYLSVGRAPAPTIVPAPAVAIAPSLSAPEIPDAPAAPAPVEIVTPSFDELRRETDGSTLIAGRAAPLSEVKVLVDGIEVATTTADTSGGFAAFAALPAATAPQVVTLSARNGVADVPSTDQIILAPVAPEAVALTQKPPADPATAAAPQAPDIETTAAAPVIDTASAGETADARSAAAPAPQTLAPLVAEDAGIAPDVAAATQEPAVALQPHPAEVAVLQSDETGVRLLQSARPEAMTRVALDTIGYSAIGDVQLAGRAQDNATEVRIYLDNRAVVSLPVDAQGRWQGDLPNVDEGVYTLRVDEVSADGDVSSRVETPFKRESAETLAEATARTDRPVSVVTVQQGATLWAIARERYGDGTLYVRVFEANAKAIRDPDLIYPGQVFDLPDN